MDGGRLLVFLKANSKYKQLLGDFEASGALLVPCEGLSALRAAMRDGDYDAILTSKEQQKNHPELESMELPCLLADELFDAEESDLIDPFAQLGEQSVLAMLDSQLDRVEEIIDQLEGA
jgi:hypothetical protein